MCNLGAELHVSHDLEFPDLVFSRLHDAVESLLVARVAVADIFLQEFAQDVFSRALRERVMLLLEARSVLDSAACAYCEVGALPVISEHSDEGPTPGEAVP